MDKFLKLIAELMETEMELTPETEYRKMEEWDSLTVISFLAMVDVEYDKTLRVADVRDTHTLQDLYDVVQKAAAHA